MSAYSPALRNQESFQSRGWKAAQIFTVATGASQLVACSILSLGQYENAVMWLATSGLAVGAGTFVLPWTRSRRLLRPKPQSLKAARQRLDMLQALALPARTGYHRLMISVRQAGDLLRIPVDPTSGAGAPRRLEHLLWLYLRLLTANQQLRTASRGLEAGSLEAEAAELRESLAAGRSSTAARSRRAALEVIEERLRTHAANERRQEEIACDLRRIEHHCALFLEQAAHAGSMGDVSLLIDLDLTAGASLELFSDASQHLLHDCDSYYASAA